MRGGKRPADRDRDVALFLVSLGFVLGTVAGYLLVGALGSEVWSERFLGTADLAPATLRQESWAVLRWPVAVVLLSLLPLAGLTIPVLFFLRGLFLSHAVAALTAASGPVGPLSAVVLLGPTGLLAIPAFFVLGTLGLLRQVDPGGAAWSRPPSAARRPSHCASCWTGRSRPHCWSGCSSSPYHKKDLRPAHR